VSSTKGFTRVEQQDTRGFLARPQAQVWEASRGGSCSDYKTPPHQVAHASNIPLSADYLLLRDTAGLQTVFGCAERPATSSPWLISRCSATTHGEFRVGAVWGARFASTRDAFRKDDIDAGLRLFADAVGGPGTRSERGLIKSKRTSLHKFAIRIVELSRDTRARHKGRTIRVKFASVIIG
jgi:hypothetical protein